MISLDSKIEELHRVGAATAKILARLGLRSAQDLLFYFPFRYDDFTKSLAISDLSAGLNANIIGTVELIQNRRSHKRKMFLTEALISDAGDTIKILWFNQPFLTRTLKIGDRISVAGRVSDYHGQLAFVSPLYEKIYSDDLIHTKGLIPNYHLTSSLSQKQIRSLIKQVIDLARSVPDWLPTDIKKRLGLLDLSAAIHQIHFPQKLDDAFAAQKRLGFTELFLRQLKAQMIKQELKSRRAPALKFQEKATQDFVASLPFKLTNAQKKAAWEILQDMAGGAPMSRLLEGDVGSGKTLVAVMAMLNCVLNKKQAALMVPTEILAEQHYNSLRRLLSAYNFKIELLTHSHKSSEALNADIIIGTQALIQDTVKFPRLALVIVDEQHRFGVKQRQKLLDFLPAETTKESNTNRENILTPHFLSMTATPIPRSLALAIYGDLDLSIINQLPANRKKIITSLVTEAKRAAAYDFIRKQIKAGHQAFVVCPLIDESDKLGVKSVKTEHAKLDKEIFPELKVGLLHGKLKSKEKEAIMADFVAGKIQILVSTSVIEVGVDVPNATLMIIEGAERFGLATLHQFRGRVGRSDLQSYCLLFPTNEELSNPKTIERLEAMTKYNDGFSLAKIDLKLRGAGELYGIGQSGFPELQIATLFDYENIKKAQAEASALIINDPELKKYPLLKAKLGEWEESIHLE
ncbi:MAG: ATP-dependent DNA helicase RecG [Patescibacteria group bacterium]